MYQIQNSHLTLTVDPVGAQMTSLKGADGTEYLWQGDAAYWGKHAPLLFPFIGRAYENRCTALGQPYPMPRHGFANVSRFTLAQRRENALVLELTESEDTLAKYPFRFTLRVGYTLEENRLAISYQVENRDHRPLSFALGFHPGFRVPLSPGEAFEDYYLQFDPCMPDRVGFTEAVLLSGRDSLFPLEEDCTLSLRHDLFDDDAIVLKNVSRSVALRSRRSNREIRLSYPDMPYLGLWHPAKTDAPFLCIEPWSSLPGRDGVVEELTARSDFPRLEVNGSYRNEILISLR